MAQTTRSLDVHSIQQGKKSKTQNTPVGWHKIQVHTKLIKSNTCWRCDHSLKTQRDFVKIEKRRSFSERQSHKLTHTHCYYQRLRFACAIFNNFNYSAIALWCGGLAAQIDFREPIQTHKECAKLQTEFKRANHLHGDLHGSVEDIYTVCLVDFLVGQRDWGVQKKKALRNVFEFVVQFMWMHFLPYLPYTRRPHEPVSNICGL